MSWVSDNADFIVLSPDKLLAITAYGEAGNQGSKGMAAVLSVIKNRTKDVVRYGDPEIFVTSNNSPWHAVILKPYQFSVFNLDDPGRDMAIRMAKHWDSYYSANATLREAYSLAQDLMVGKLSDATMGATYYHANYVSPSWAKDVNFIKAIGDHLFYTAKAQSPILLSSSLVIGFLVLAIIIGKFLKRGD